MRADEQVRQVQEELRKRNLFFANPNGEFTPALTSALSRYQSRKGFPVTGLLDAETSFSLGIVPAPPQVAPTPFVVAQTGDVRGMNGERLPGCTALFARVPDPSTQVESRGARLKETVARLPEPPAVDLQKSKSATRHRASPSDRPPVRRRGTNPFLLAYESVDHAVKAIFGEGRSKKKRDVKKRG